MNEETPRHLPPEALEEWLGKVKDLLALDQQIDVAAVLDLTRDVAHDVARPAAPLTTFALGLALGNLPAEEFESKFIQLHAELTRLASEQQGP